MNYNDVNITTNRDEREWDIEYIHISFNVCMRGLLLRLIFGLFSSMTAKGSTRWSFCWANFRSKASKPERKFGQMEYS